MTDEELRAIDAEVAVKVFGWTREQVGLAEDCAGGSIAACNKMTTGPIPPYSTEIAAAWMVVEKLSSMPGCRGIEVENAATQCGSWGCAVWWKDGVTFKSVHAYETLSPTAPLAICRAALKAVEGKE